MNRAETPPKLEPIPLAQLPAGQQPFLWTHDGAYERAQVLGGPDRVGLYALRLGNARVIALADTVVYLERP